MEKQLNFVFPLPLEELVLRRIVINLWTAADVLASIANVQITERPVRGCIRPIRPPRQRLYRTDEEWRATVEIEVKAKVSELPLPEPLKKRIMEIVSPVGLQIRVWEILMSDYISDVRNETYVHFLEQLQWTSAGAVDYRKTAEKLVFLKSLPVLIRYSLACSYCLVDALPIVWEELTEENRRHFCKDRILSLYTKDQLKFYWAYSLSGEGYNGDRLLVSADSDKTSFSQYVFERSAYEGNRALTEHFFQKLTYEEKQGSLVNSAQTVLRILNKKNSSRLYPMDTDCNVFYYLLSVMSSEQQMEVFRDQPNAVLLCFLQWPLQDFFLDIADVIWTVLPETAYESVTTGICYKIKSLGYYFPYLIQKLAMRSPRNFRRIFALEFLFIFPEVSYSEDTVTAKVLFRNIDPEDRIQFISSYRLVDFFKGLISRNKWDLVEVCLRALDLSKEEREKMHTEVHSYIPSTFKIEDSTHSAGKLKRCLDLLDDTEESSPKKSLADNQCAKE